MLHCAHAPKPGAMDVQAQLCSAVGSVPRRGHAKRWHQSHASAVILRKDFDVWLESCISKQELLHAALVCEFRSD